MTPLDKMTDRKLRREYEYMVSQQDEDIQEWHDWALDEEDVDELCCNQSRRAKAKKRDRRSVSEG